MPLIRINATDPFDYWKKERLLLEEMQRQYRLLNIDLRYGPTQAQHAAAVNAAIRNLNRNGW